MTKNNRAMERMKPQLEKLQKQYGGNKELYSQKQMELYRKEKYSMMGACLPTLLTMVIFIMVFSGFNGMISQQNKKMYLEMEGAYNSAYTATVGEPTAKREAAETAVLKAYEDNYEKGAGFLWVRNVFMPDGWKKAIPDYETFTGKGLGKLSIGTDIFSDDPMSTYNKVMLPLQNKYNNRWNGFLILPLLSILVSFASQKLMKQEQPPTPPSNGANGQDMQGAMQANMKMMQYFLPLMLGVFAVFYSTAFTIYMVTSSILTTLFQLTYNIIAKKIDKRNEEARLKTTYK
ncbi:MAG: membrane protein insertase YidC, partial [Clostridia bacterium]